MCCGQRHCVVRAEMRGMPRQSFSLGFLLLTVGNGRPRRGRVGKPVFDSAARCSSVCTRPNVFAGKDDEFADLFDSLRRELRQQRLRLLQIESVEALGEPAVDPRK
jgi:hypothetical protein